ncbi:hypothetical protein FQR65_LT12422 [Abscondita terminalis]|nr:hypothetical protein FQR65_LT12422 [Abscondita terminalis]
MRIQNGQWIFSSQRLSTDDDDHHGRFHQRIRSFPPKFSSSGSFSWSANAIAEKKLWKYDNDVTSPKNWESSGGNCSGFVFPETLESIGSVKQMKTSEILLPINGELEIQNGGFIEFSSDRRCEGVRVGEISSRRWLDPRNWEFSENAARPDAEKVPCVNDDVVFASEDVAVTYPEVAVTVNSVQIKGVWVSDEQWQNFLGSDYGVDQFHTRERSGKVAIAKKECEGGCVCHENLGELLEWVCDGLPPRSEECFGGIRLVGFCGEVCGGVVYLDAGRGFSMDALKRRLPKEVDAYASKVMVGTKSSVQVVFMEKDGYTELSAEVARDFYKSVREDFSGFRVVGAWVLTSGVRLPNGSPSATAFAIVLGTFAAVVSIFGCVYLMYVGPLRDYDVVSRILGERSQYFFNKFDNRDISTSMISLEKSFANPMYEAQEAVPSTSSEPPVPIKTIKHALDKTIRNRQSLLRLEFQSNIIT